MSPSTLFWALLALTTAGCAACCVASVRSRRARPAVAALAVAFALGAACVGMAGSGALVPAEARAHGAGRGVVDMTYREIFSAVEASPVQSDPALLADGVPALRPVLVYKFGCPACQRSWGEVWGLVGPLSPVCVEASSAEGAALTNSFGLKGPESLLWRPAAGAPVEVLNLFDGTREQGYELRRASLSLLCERIGKAQAKAAGERQA